MRKCAICDTSRPEPIVQLVSTLLDLRIRAGVVNVRTPLSGDYCHASCALGLRAKIEKKEKRNAIAHR